MIKCRTCGVLKEKSEFYLYKGKVNGKECKSCRSLRNKQEYKNKKANFEKEQPDEKDCSGCGETKTLCKFDKNPRSKDGHTGRCKDCINKRRREKYAQKSKSQKRDLYIKNKEYYTNYRRERMKRDPAFKVRARFGTLVSRSVKERIDNSCFDYLPYSFDELLNHLEEKFTIGMSWDNYGNWHIDHIKPQSSFNWETHKDKDFQECWALENLQPLWAADNIKKSNKILSTNADKEGI